MVVNPEGLLVNHQQIPLWSGEIHFWRMAPENWENALEQIKHLGLPIVATYLSWRRHEPQPDIFDFDGRTQSCLNVVKFLELCSRAGLYVHLKPGPWICAEEPAGGYPDWLIKRPEIQALGPNNLAVLGYNPPFQSPIPCLLHPEYLERAERWLTAVDEVIRSYCYPQGPVLLVQLDNEPSLTFHDRMFESDYNLEIVKEGGVYQRWLIQTGRSLDSYPAPRSLKINQWSDLSLYSDWEEFKEWMLNRHIEFLRLVHLKNGLSDILFTTNMNGHEQLSTPNQWIDLQQASGLTGYDYYFIPPFREQDIIDVALAVNYSLAVAPLAWAPEMMAGIWISPGMDEDHPGFEFRDLEFLHFVGLAFGLKGMNFYMAVNRENWESAPIQENGEPGETFSGLRKVLDLRQKLLAFSTLQPERQVAVLFDPQIAREAYITSGTEIELDGYRLGSAYHLFCEVYQKLVHLNYNPAIIDFRVNPQEITRYKAVFVPAAPYLRRELQAQLIEAGRMGVQIIFLEKFPHLDSDFLSQMAFPVESSSIIHIGKGELLAINCSKIESFLKEMNLLPKVQSSDPDVLTIIQRNEFSEVLFVINSGGSPIETTLIFHDLETGRLQDAISQDNPIMIHKHKACLSLLPHSVRVYITQH
jgi:beta-galactosidase